MRILIFEGIATSGKSTLIEKLRNSFRDTRIVVVGEAETHEPIMKDTSDAHVAFFADLLKQKTATDADLVIFDRLYLTQANRANVSLESYAEIERLLAPYQPFTAFLKVQDAAIEQRVQTASQHRDNSWKEHIGTKGDTPAHIAQYYITQQSRQLELLKTSRIPFKIFDTTGHNYPEITQQLLAILATRS